MATSHDGHDHKPHLPSDPAAETHGRTEEEERIHQRKDELLDQGVDETFPASDPVAVKHIT
jgi:hypothetical protein